MRKSKTRPIEQPVDETVYIHPITCDGFEGSVSRATYYECRTTAVNVIFSDGIMGYYCTTHSDEIQAAFRLAKIVRLTRPSDYAPSGIQFSNFMSLARKRKT
jgi:hypothetical protein